jgi:hypothetical protein
MMFPATAIPVFNNGSANFFIYAYLDAEFVFTIPDFVRCVLLDLCLPIKRCRKSGPISNSNGFPNFFKSPYFVSCCQTSLFSRHIGHLSSLNHFCPQNQSKSDCRTGVPACSTLKDISEWHKPLQPGSTPLWLRISNLMEAVNKFSAFIHISNRYYAFNFFI